MNATTMKSARRFLRITFGLSSPTDEEVRLAKVLQAPLNVEPRLFAMSLDVSITAHDTMRLAWFYHGVLAAAAYRRIPRDLKLLSQVVDQERLNQVEADIKAGRSSSFLVVGC